MLNAGSEPIAFKVPQWQRCRGWNQLLDTTVMDGGTPGDMLRVGQMAQAPPRALLVFEGVQ